MGGGQCRPVGTLCCGSGMGLEARWPGGGGASGQVSVAPCSVSRASGRGGVGAVPSTVDGTRPASAVGTGGQPTLLLAPAEAARAFRGPGVAHRGDKTPSICRPVSPLVASCSLESGPRWQLGSQAPGTTTRRGSRGGAGAGGGGCGVSSGGVCVRWAPAGVEAGPGRRARIREVPREGTSGRTLADLREVRAGSRPQGAASNLQEGAPGPDPGGSSWHLSLTVCPGPPAPVQRPEEEVLCVGGRRPGPTTEVPGSSSLAPGAPARAPRPAACRGQRSRRALCLSFSLWAMGGGW